jgi:hypothetical protein
MPDPDEANEAYRAPHAIAGFQLADIAFGVLVRNGILPKADAARIFLFYPRLRRHFDSRSEKTVSPHIQIRPTTRDSICKSPTTRVSRAISMSLSSIARGRNRQRFRAN